MAAGAKAVKNCGPVILMLPEMSVKVGLLAKASFTQVTLIRLLLVMNISNMSLKIRRYGKRPFAKLALVGLFAGVRPQMPS